MVSASLPSEIPYPETKRKSDTQWKGFVSAPGSDLIV